VSLDLNKLNASQREAVLTTNGPVLVLAGAGTGKTRVITYRIAQLISQGIAPDRILSVTFTNKAAREMQERATHILGGGRKNKKQKPPISTFHSLCVKILRQEINQLGYPLTFSIMDRSDQESLAREILRSIKVPESTMKPADLINRISRWKTAGHFPVTAAMNTEDDRDFLAAAGYRRYMEKLQATARVDFDDLLLLTSRLFKEFPDVLARQQERFDFVQIDEYQDTNGLQFELIESLVKQHKNLCVVGDDDQSIYGWRGADVKHILSFDKQFPGAKVIRLEENYRCTDEILNMANKLVANNKHRHGKTLVAHKPSQEEVRIVEFPDAETESEKVVYEIYFYLKHEVAKAGDFAILFRTNEQPRVFETELRRRQIPYVIVGSQSFFDAKETRDLQAYLKAIASPHDDQSLLRIINTPPRGIGNTTTEKILNVAVRKGITFWQATREPELKDSINDKTRNALKRMEALLLETRRKFEEQPLQFSHHFKQFLEEINYRSEIDRLYDEPEMRETKLNMMNSFHDAMAGYIEREPDPTVHEFLDQITLAGKDELGEKEEQLAQDGVKLMTYHSAKGLEFPRVYMVGMEEGIMPHKRSVESASGEIDEERRLAYVGVTRAMDQLTLTFCANRRKWGKMAKCVPSRFLREMRGNSAHDPEGEISLLLEDEE
jgi:DNA helicase-2/ATP-dependent DNA helicase PcrA